MQVLIIEDDFRLAQDLADLVERMGHAALTAGSASEAIELLKTVPVDAAIVDIFVIKQEAYLPDGGLRFISRLRQDFFRELRMPRKAPILAISGGSDIAGGYSPLKVARQLGATYTLKKPFKPTQVQEYLGKMEDACGAPQA